MVYSPIMRIKSLFLMFCFFYLFCSKGNVRTFLCGKLPSSSQNFKKGGALWQSLIGATVIALGKLKLQAAFID